MLKKSGIPNALVEAMIKKGYEKLTPVQEEVVKKSYSGLDLLVSAQTGSGKTIAFGFSIMLCRQLLNRYTPGKIVVKGAKSYFSKFGPITDCIGV